MVTAICSCFFSSFGFKVEGKIGFREGLCLPSIRSPRSSARPTPLYFMDEIDAALDFRNVSIIANYIKDLTSVLTNGNLQARSGPRPGLGLRVPRSGFGLRGFLGERLLF